MKNVPDIRFKGTASIWEYKKFSYFIERVSMSRKAGEIPGIEYEDIISGEGVFNKNIFTKKCDKKGVLFVNGDILFGKLRPYLKNIILATFEGVAIGDFWIFRSKDVDCRCVYYLVNSNSFMKIANISSGSKMPRADWNLISGTKFNFPKDTTEQKNIGTFFYELDRNIYSSKSRLASLKQLKSASLISMFPQQGETVPRVRFKGFDGEWALSKLGELFEERIENEPNAEMLSVTMNNGIIKAVDNGRYDNSNSNKAKYKLVNIGDIAYNSMRMWQGASGVSIYRGIVSPAYTVVKPNDAVDSLFFSYMFKTDEVVKKFRLSSQGLTKDTWNLKYPAFSEIYVLYPTKVAEQHQIASYFHNLDIQISEQEKRLEKLKQIKAACLDKMFV